MKLNSNVFQSWLKSSSKGVRFFLIYGYDLGQVKILSDDLVAHLKTSLEEVNLVNISYDQIKSDLSALREELSSVSLFGGTNVIVINNAAPALPKELQSLLENNKSDAVIIFQSEELRPSSTLRKSFESMKNGVAIACYKDDISSLTTFIRQFFIDRTIQVERDVPSLLASLLPANRLIVIGALEKLILYKDEDDSAITTTDVLNVVIDDNDLSFDELCMAYILNDSKNIQKHLSRILAQDANFMLIIRVLQKYLYRLFEIFSRLQEGSTIDASVAKLSPPVFFKQKDNLMKVIRLTNMSAIKFAISDLLILESNCKSGTLDSQSLLINFLTLHKIMVSQ